MTLKDNAGTVLEVANTFGYATNPSTYVTGNFSDGNSILFDRSSYDLNSGTYGQELRLEVIINDPNCCTNVNTMIIPPVFSAAFDNHAINSANTATDGSYVSTGAYPAANPPSWGVGMWSWIAATHYNVGACGCSGPPWDGCSRVRAPATTDLFISEVTIDGVTTTISPAEQLLVPANGIILNSHIFDSVNASSQIMNLLGGVFCSRPSSGVEDQIQCDHFMGQYNIFFSMKQFETFKVSDENGVHVATAVMSDTSGEY